MKFIIGYGVYSSNENEKIVEVETMDQLYEEINELFIETTYDDMLGRNIEDIMNEEDVDFDTACGIYNEERKDWFNYDIEKIEEE